MRLPGVRVRHTVAVSVTAMIVAACSSAGTSTPTTLESSSSSAAPTSVTTLGTTTAAPSTPSTTGSSVEAGGALYEALRTTPLPAEGLPDYSSLPLEFELDFEQPTEVGGVLRFFASPSAGTSVIILYQLAPEPSFEGVPASSMVSAAAGEAELESQTTPSLAGVDDVACGTWTELLPTAVCFALVGENVVLTRSTLVLFEAGGSNESMATDLLAYAVDHLLEVAAGSS